MNFTFDLSIQSIILLSVACVSALIDIPLYRGRLRRLNHAAWRQASDFAGTTVTTEVSAETDGADTLVSEGFSIDPQGGFDTSDLEPVSVVVYAQDEAERLAGLLPRLLSQSYPPGFEVIVVNEGASEATSDIVNQLALTHSNLYMTFTPDGARNLSRKKLALMLGIKAARNRVVVNTTAAARIDSDQWLLAMARNFSNPSVEVVLGYAYPVGTDNGAGKRHRSFDYVAHAMTWLTAALGGHPYRGTEFNIAYTRNAFFRNKGFSKSLNLRYGDDDIFISEIANAGNTAVELSPESMVGVRMYNVKRECRDLARRHEFTGRFITKGPRRAVALGSWLMWLCIGCCIAAGIVALPNLVPAIIAFVIAVALLVAVTVNWHKTMKIMHGRKLMLTIPWLALTYPLRNAMRTLYCRMHKGRNYTWS